MPLRDDLLNPIPGDNPSGADLRYDPLYDKIKEARREEDDVPQGDWQRARKTADYAQVIKLAGEAVATKTKDLQLAAWLTEALVKREGASGLRAGLGLIQGLIERFWETLHPEIEDGDVEMRAAPVSWVGTKLDVAVRLMPLDRAGHDLLQYTNAQNIGTEDEARSDSGKKAAREAAVAGGAPLLEDFEKSLVDTPKPFFKQLVADIDGSLATVRALDAMNEEKFGDESPNLIPVRNALEEVQRVAKKFLERKLELEPDPVEVAPVVVEDVGASGEGGSAAGAAAGGVLSAEPTSREDAALRVVSAARYLRRTEPRNPASYLMLRALRWGELRAGGATPDPKLLDAPSTAMRTQLRSLMLDENWEHLLEAAETVMGSSVGRGWLDLQRYALMACQALGEDYAIVASAIRSELRSLLAAIPSLPNMSLMDDLPTATNPTLNWLREQGLVGGEAEPEPVELAPVEHAAAGADGASRETSAALARASAEVRAGRPEKAIEMLMRALDREKTRRGRFLRQAELAGLMVDAGFVQVAQPILQELVGDIEMHQLESWEAGEMVARPLALMYACLEKTEGDPAARQELYLRICKLDPLQAIGFGQG